MPMVERNRRRSHLPTNASRRPRTAFATRAIHAGQIARSDHRRRDDADLCHQHLRAAVAGRAQGLRLRPHPQSHALCLRALRGRSGRRHRRLRLRLGPGRDRARCWNCSTTARTSLVCDDLYGGTYRLFERVRRRSANLDFSYVDPTNLAAFAAAIRPNTRMIWIETPVESAAQAGRPGSALPQLARRRGMIARGRQHVRHALRAAAAGRWASTSSCTR